MESQDDLLQPSIGVDDGPATSIYSARTGYLASFFGGPVAGATVALANAYRLRRVGRDWPLAVVAMAATLLSAWWLTHGGVAWLDANVGASSQTLFLRVLGLCFFALAYAWHRPYYRNMALVGIQPQPGWPIGIGAAIGGFVLQIGLLRVFS